MHNWHILSGGFDDRATDPTWLYRYYNNQAQIIYVGITSEPCVRASRHYTKPWIDQAVAMYLECYPIRELAQKAEEYVIRDSKPIGNTRKRFASPPGPGNAAWFVEEMGGKLSGRYGYWADHWCGDLSPIEPPDGLIAPDPIVAD